MACLSLEAFELHVRIRAFADVVRVAAPLHGAPETLNVIADCSGGMRETKQRRIKENFLDQIVVAVLFATQMCGPCESAWRRRGDQPPVRKASQAATEAKRTVVLYCTEIKQARMHAVLAAAAQRRQPPEAGRVSQHVALKRSQVGGACHGRAAVGRRRRVERRGGRFSARRRWIRWRI